jgi:hypothetical protein
MESCDVISRTSTSASPATIYFHKPAPRYLRFPTCAKAVREAHLQTFQVSQAVLIKIQRIRMLQDSAYPVKQATLATFIVHTKLWNMMSSKGLPTSSVWQDVFLMLCGHKKGSFSTRYICSNHLALPVFVTQYSCTALFPDSIRCRNLSTCISSSHDASLSFLDLMMHHNIAGASAASRLPRRSLPDTSQHIHYKTRRRRC